VRGPRIYISMYMYISMYVYVYVHTYAFSFVHTHLRRDDAKLDRFIRSISRQAKACQAFH